jgi:hypothetical protein
VTLHLTNATAASDLKILPALVEEEPSVICITSYDEMITNSEMDSETGTHLEQLLFLLPPNGFPIIFYQHFWPIVKEDVLRLFQAFSKGKLQISQLSRGMVCFIPKKDQALTVKDYRPISLLNCIYKLITRVLTFRFEKVQQQIVGSTQNAFLKERYILNGAVAA